MMVLVPNLLKLTMLKFDFDPLDLVLNQVK